MDDNYHILYKYNKINEATHHKLVPAHFFLQYEQSEFLNCNSNFYIKRLDPFWGSDLLMGSNLALIHDFKENQKYESVPLSN